MLSPETYVGYARAEHFSSPAGVVPDQSTEYTRLASWISINWRSRACGPVDEEKGTLNSARGSIVFRFQARDLHLVLGPGPSGKPIRFVVQHRWRGYGRESRHGYGCERLLAW